MNENEARKRSQRIQDEKRCGLSRFGGRCTAEQKALIIKAAEKHQKETGRLKPSEKDMIIHLVEKYLKN